MTEYSPHPSLIPGLLDGSITRLVVPMEPQPTGFDSIGRPYLDQSAMSPVPYRASIPNPLGQPGDTLTIEGVEFEVVTSEAKQVKDFTEHGRVQAGCVLESNLQSDFEGEPMDGPYLTTGWQFEDMLGDTTDPNTWTFTAEVRRKDTE